MTGLGTVPEESRDGGLPSEQSSKRRRLNTGQRQSPTSCLQDLSRDTYEDRQVTLRRGLGANESGERGRCTLRLDRGPGI
jgi:hypothetical protein